MAQILGTTGDDRGATALRGTESDDDIIGLEGRDEFIPLFGTDSVNGGAGLDTLIIDYSSVDANVFYQVSTVTSPGGSSTFYSVQSGSNSVTYARIEAFDVTGSATQNNGLQGAAYADRLIGGAGADTIKSFAGDDIVDVGRGGATGATTAVDAVELGLGGDDLLIADYSAATEAVTFGATNADTTDPDDVKDFSSSGTTGARYGNFGVLSFLGVDRFEIATGSGNDAVTTGDRADVIRTGDGDDVLNSRRGEAVIDGGRGADFWGADFSDARDAFKIDLNRSGDQATAGRAEVTRIEALTLTTGAKDDVVVTHASGRYADKVMTGDGSDAVTVSGAATGAATAAIVGQGVRYDTVAMGAGGDDLLIADYSAATEAVVFGSHYADTSDPDDVKDFASLLNTGARFGGVGVLDFSGVDRFDISTGSRDDIVTTGDRADVIRTGAGDDVLNSRKGDAVIDGGRGADFWAADFSDALGALVVDVNVSGDQVIVGASEVVGVEALTLTTGVMGDVVVTHASGRFADTVTTGGGSDTVTVTGAATGAATAAIVGQGVRYDTVAMGAGGNDLLIADYAKATEAVSFRVHGNNVTAGDENSDYFSLVNTGVIFGGVGTLSYSGVERFEVTTGSKADDVATGDRDDVIRTGRGDDTLVAHGGRDTLDGGAGDDELDGGAGRDAYVFGGPKASDRAFGVDAILSFEDSTGPERRYDGLDRIDLTSFRSANGGDALAFADLLIRQVGADVAIRLDLDGDGSPDGRDKIVLRGADEADIGAADFLL